MAYDENNMPPEDSAQDSRSQRLLRKVPGAKFILNHLHARRHNSQLDETTRRLENQHMRVLHSAKLHHDNVRGAAEAAQMELEAREARRARKLQIRNEQRRQQAMEERLRLEQIAQESYERQKEEEARLDAQIEARRAQEAADRRALEQRRRERDEAEAARRESEAQQETLRQQEQEKQRISAEQKAASPKRNSQPIDQHPDPTAGHIQVHQRYLLLHQKLKSMRKQVEDAKTQYPRLKKELGDIRRSLRSDFSKFTRDVVSNRSIIARIKNTLIDASRIDGPTLDVRDYIVSPIPASVDQSHCQVAAVRIYLLSHMAKALVKQMIQCGSTPDDADNLALGAVSVLADPNVRWQGVPMSDVFLAKFHKTIPVLFGINGNPQTDRGREALGWAREHKHEPWSGIQRATEKWTGMGSGFAALTLRAFSNPCIIPFPPRLYWESMARLLNTPINERTAAHFFLVKALVQFSLPKIIRTFGQLGIALVRKTVFDYPKGSSVEGAKDLVLLLDIFSRDHSMRL